MGASCAVRNLRTAPVAVAAVSSRAAVVTIMATVIAMTSVMTAAVRRAAAGAIVAVVGLGQAMLCPSSSRRRRLRSPRPRRQ